MKLAYAPLPGLGRSLAATGLMIAAGAALVVAADAQLRTAAARSGDAARQLAEYREKLRQAADEAEQIRQDAAGYERLRVRGIVGGERRRDWVELILAIQARRRLTGLHYEFAPQRRLDPPQPASPGFRSSRMSLQMPLLHEGDLVGFIDDLRREAPAIVRVRRCRVARLAAAGDGAQLIADCQLDWITLAPAQRAP